MTKTVSHTPGPWRIGDAGLTVFGPPNGSFPEIIAPCKSRANARLIAAAPELLQALRDIASIAADCDLKTIRDIARAAIAQAEGRP